MPELNLIITGKDELRSLIYQWMDEHPYFLCKNEPDSLALSKPMNRKQLAEYLDISTETVNKWMKKGLPYKKMHGRVFFIIDDVIAAMSSFNHKNKTALTN